MLEISELFDDEGFSVNTTTASVYLFPERFVRRVVITQAWPSCGFLFVFLSENFKTSSLTSNQVQRLRESDVTDVALSFNCIDAQKKRLHTFEMSRLTDDVRL